jgi:hypothetical protein
MKAADVVPDVVLNIVEDERSLVAGGVGIGVGQQSPLVHRRIAHMPAFGEEAFAGDPGKFKLIMLNSGDNLTMSFREKVAEDIFPKDVVVETNSSIAICALVAAGIRVGVVNPYRQYIRRPLRDTGAAALDRGRCAIGLVGEARPLAFSQTICFACLGAARRRPPLATGRGESRALSKRSSS